jgi:MFS family permease
MRRWLPATSIFRHRDYGRYLGARFISAVASQMQTVAVGWLVYDITRDPWALGLTGLALFLPAVALVLVTGAVADRHDRRIVLVISYLVATCAAGGLLLFAASGSQDIGWLYGLLLIFGTSRAFANPAGQALIPNLVPRDELGTAIAWSASAWQLAIILGPAIGGLLYLLGPVATLATVTGLLGLSCLLFGTLGPHPQPDQVATSRETLLAGIRFIRRTPAILGATTLDLFAVLLGGVTALLPIFARDILHVGPAGLGLLRSMPALGALAMALWLAAHPRQRRVGEKMFAAVAVYGLATVIFGLSRELWLSLLALLVLGAADMVSVFVRQTLVQFDTPNEMRGRVAAVNSLFIGASNELGEFESGAMAALIGTVPAVVVGGVGTLAVVGLWRRWFPALRQRDTLVT